MDDKKTAKHSAEEPECAADFELILEWAELAACRVRRHVAKFEEIHQKLASRPDTARRQREFDHWQDSPAFTEREKAALRLSEEMSFKQSEEVPKAVLKEAKGHFNRTEMVHLALGVLAMNDWINTHANFPAHVLVVEDDAEDRDLLRWQLKTAQMEDNVIFVPDAPQALAVLEGYRSGQREGELLALFLDLRLPGMNGVELLRRIRAMPDMEHLPVIVMTASSDPKDMEECRELKVVSYVEKPVTVCSFSKAVAGIFHQSKGA
jgi:CheY-like chemotaxis protein